MKRHNADALAGCLGFGCIAAVYLIGGLVSVALTVGTVALCVWAVIAILQAMGVI